MDIVKYYVGRADAPRPNKPIHLGANVLVICRRRLLLERRRDCQRWGLIGGGCKRGEALDACAARELWEETGIRVSPGALTPLKFYDQPVRIAAFVDKSVWRMVMKLYAIRLEQVGDLKASSESMELGFFTVEELRQLDIVETHRQLVEDYLELIDTP